MNSKSIPTDEDFARARAAMEHRDRGLSEVRSNILKQFNDDGLHQIFIFYSPEYDLFVTYLFFRNEENQMYSEKSGLTELIKNSVLEELERVGRGEKFTLNVNFEIDNDNNVQRQYDGDYYARLR